MKWAGLPMRSTGCWPRYQADDQALRDANQSLGHGIVQRKRKQEEIEKLHKDLVHASRQAGMAEVATGVLHNVGNVLNSVNVSVNLLGEYLNQSQCANLLKLSALLEAHRTDLPGFLANDPKGRRIPELVTQLALALEEERGQLRSEMGTLARNVDHIKEIVAMQQNYATVAGVTEDLSGGRLIEDALRMNTGAFQRHRIESSATSRTSRWCAWTSTRSCKSSSISCATPSTRGCRNPTNGS